MKLTQKDLVLKYIREFGSILPAKKGGDIYLGEMFGSETSKRCREMRREGILVSSPDESNPKFERFFINPNWDPQGKLF